MVRCFVVVIESACIYCSYRRTVLGSTSFTEIGQVLMLSLYATCLSCKNLQLNQIALSILHTVLEIITTSTTTLCYNNIHRTLRNFWDNLLGGKYLLHVAKLLGLRLALEQLSLSDHHCGEVNVG